MMRLRLLGSLALIGEDGSSVRSILAQPKRFALLAYLAASPSGSKRSRDTLLGLLWPDLNDERARKALRQALYGLRKSLGPGVVTGKGEALVAVDPERIWCDVVAFSAAVEEGREEQALALYAGAFLEGFHVSGAREFERWMDGMRRRLRMKASSAAWKLVAKSEDEGETAQARRWAERALELTPYDGQGIRRYMSLMDRLGMPAAAIRAYDAYVERLAADLDLRPSPETAVLVDRIRNEGGSRAAHPGDASETTPRNGGPHGHAEIEADVRPEPNDPVSSSVSIEDARQSSSDHDSVVPNRDDEPASAPRLRSLDWNDASPLSAIVAFLAVTIIAAAAIAVFGGGESSGADGLEIGSVAVLPLEDVSGDSAQEYLTDGMSEALIGELGEIEALEVISRTSAMSYRGSDKRIPVIARELNVDGVVEGSVLRSGNRIRVTLRLLHGPSGRQLWTESYERHLEQLLALQDRMARDIARAAHADVSPLEARRMAEPPTEVARAYAFYLRGNDYLRRESRKNWELAERMYETAVRLDGNFAKAWERLVYVRGSLLVSRFDTARLNAAREGLERLRELEPDSEVTHAAEGWYALWAEHDLERALHEFEIVHRRRPGDSGALWALAAVHHRAAHWEDAVVQLHRLVQLDPRNPEVARRLARVLAALRRFDEAERYINLALSLAPDNHFSYVTKWRILALGHGDTARAARLVQEAARYVRPEERAWLAAIVAEFRRDFSSAIEGFRAWPARSWTKYLYVTRLADRVGNTELAEIYADSLKLIATERMEKAIRHQNVPQIAVARYHLGRVHAINGRLEEAIREGEEGLTLLPLGTNSSAASMAQGLVWIYARAGRQRDALRLLERLLALPGGETVHSLRLNPVYDALRDDPGFLALMRRAEAS